MSTNSELPRSYHKVQAEWSGGFFPNPPLVLEERELIGSLFPYEPLTECATANHG